MLYNDSIFTYSIVLLRFRIEHSCLLWSISRPFRKNNLGEAITFQTLVLIHEYTAGIVAQYLIRATLIINLVLQMHNFAPFLPTQTTSAYVDND